MNSTAYEYIYLLIEREFIKTNENIYKIGKTQQENFLRFTQYPKGSNLLLFLNCKNCDILEFEILKDFKKHFIQRKDIGKEYFEGDKEEMIKHIFNLFFWFNKNACSFKCDVNQKENNEVNEDNGDNEENENNEDNEVNEDLNCIQNEKSYYKVYKCMKCNRVFKRKAHLLNHINKKNPCV
jgi:hypothetical protein